MRKIAKYLVAAMGMVAAVACNKEFSQEVRPEQNGNSYTFTATIGVETKTVLDGMKSRWMGDADGNEYIHVLDNEGNRDTYVAAGITEPTDNAVFTFSGEEATITGNSVVAIYPSIYGDEWVPTDAIAEEGFHSVKVIYRSDQAAVENSYDPQGPVAMAYIDDLSESQSFSFKNMSALLKFSLAADSDPVDNVTLYIPNGGNGVLSGTVIITEENGEYTFEGDVNPQGWVALNGKIEPGKTYYIAVVPGTVDGLTFQMNKDADQEVTINREITFERNRIYDLGSSFSYTEQDLNLGLIGAFNNWNAPDVKMTLLGGGMYAAYNVALEGDFKIRGNESWDEGNPNYGLNVAGTITAGYYYYVKDGGQNATIEAGTYDVYLDVKSYKLYVVNAGESIDGLTEGEVVLPEVVGKTVTVYCDTDYTHFYYWTSEGGNTWPGTEYSGTETYNGKNCKKWVITVPENQYGLTFQCIFNGNGSQTGDSESFNFKEVMYFSIDNNVAVGDNVVQTPMKAGISGTFNGWSYTEATEVSHSGNTYTFKLDEVALADGDNFKIRVRDAWIGYGACTIEGISVSDAGGNDHNILYSGSEATYSVTISFDWNGSYSNVKAVFTLVPTVLPTPEGKQWILDSSLAAEPDFIGMPAATVLCLGVNSPGYLAFGVSVLDLYGPEAAAQLGGWMMYNAVPFTVEPTDATSGKLIISNGFGEPSELPYWDLTEDSCCFDLTKLLSVGESVKGKLSDEFVALSGGVGGM